MYGNTANMVETRSEPESYEFEFMPLVTSCGSRLPRWPFTDLGLLVFMPCVGRFPTVGGTSRIQQKWCYGTSKSRLWKTLWFPILSLRSFSLGRLQPCGEKRQVTYSFPDLEPVFVPCPVITVASWPAYRFLKTINSQKIINLSIVTNLYYCFFHFFFTYFCSDLHDFFPSADVLLFFFFFFLF